MQLPKENMTQILRDFLQSQSVCILATVNHLSIPRATPTHYFADDDLRCYIISDDNTTKLENIQNNANVSLCICDSRSFDPNDRGFSNCKGVQITGIAKILDETSEPEERAAALRVYKWEIYTDVPPTQKIIVVNPQKIEMLDLTPEGFMSLSAEKGLSTEKVSPKQIWNRDD